MTERLLRSTVTVSAATLASRLLGFLRDIVIARAFGAGLGADAFFVAFRIPNLLRRLFAEGAFSQAFVPVFAEYRATRSHKTLRALVAHVSGTLGVALLGVVLMGMMAAPLVTMAFAPGFLSVPEKYTLTADLVRITFPYLLFISLAAVAAGVLNAHGRFAAPALTPGFLNLAIICAVLFLAPHMERGVEALAWGVVVGGTLQLIFQLPFLARIGLLVPPRPKLGDPGVRRILRLMLPATFGVSVAQLNLLVDTLIASFLTTGSVSWLYYSDRLLEFPLGVFGVALGTAVLPHLSEQHARNSRQAFSGALDWALRWVLVVGMPACIGLLSLAGPILATLFQYGEFAGDDVRMAQRSLVAYALGLVPLILIKVLAPGFYARQDMRTPVRIALIALACNGLLNLLLVIPLAHAGLALATSISALVNAALLLRSLRRRGIYAPRPGWRSLTARILAASALLAFLLLAGPDGLEVWLSENARYRILHLGLWIAAGAGLYVGALWATGVRWHHLHAAGE